MHGLTRLYLCACEKEGCLANSELVSFFTELEKSSFDGENGSASLFASSIFKHEKKANKMAPKHLLSSANASAVDAASDASEKMSLHHGSNPADAKDAVSCRGSGHLYGSQSSSRGCSSSSGRAASKKEVASLPSVGITFLVGSPTGPITMDLSQNYLGDAGVAAVFRVLPLLRWVTRVNAQGCGAGPRAVKALCDALTMELPITTAPTARPAWAEAEGTPAASVQISSPPKGVAQRDLEGKEFYVRSTIPSSIGVPSASPVPEMCFGMPLLPLEVIDLRQNPLFAVSGRLLCHALKTRHRLTAYYRQKMALPSPTPLASPTSSSRHFSSSYHSGTVDLGTTPVDIRAVEVLVDSEGFPPLMASTLRELQQVAHEERQDRQRKHRMQKEEEEMKLFSVYYPTGGNGRSSGGEPAKAAVAGGRQPTGEHLIYRIPAYTSSLSTSPLVLPKKKDDGFDEDDKRRTGNVKSTVPTSSAFDSLPEVLGVQERDDHVRSFPPSAASLSPFYDVSNPHLCREVREMNEHMEAYLVAFRCLSTRHPCLPPREEEEEEKKKITKRKSSPVVHALAKGWTRNEDTSENEIPDEEGEEDEDDGGRGIHVREECVEQALAAAELCVDLGADTLTFLPLTTAAVWYTPEKEEEEEKKENVLSSSSSAAAAAAAPRRWCAELLHHVRTLLRGFYANPHLETELETHRGPLLVTYIAQLKAIYYATTMALPNLFREGGASEATEAASASPTAHASSSSLLRSLLPDLYQLEVLYCRVVAALTTTRMSDLPSMAHVEDRLQAIRAYMLDFLLLGTADASGAAPLPAHTTTPPMPSSPGPFSSSSSSSPFGRSMMFPFMSTNVAADGRRGVLPVWCAEMKYFLWNEASQQHEWNTVLVPREHQQERERGGAEQQGIGGSLASLVHAEKPLGWRTHAGGGGGSPRMGKMTKMQKTPSPPPPPDKDDEKELHTKKEMKRPTTPRTAIAVPPKYRSLLQCRCPQYPHHPCALSSPLSGLVVLPSPVGVHSAAATSSSPMACRVRWADSLPRPCPSCCHAALSILPAFFRNPFVLRRMVLQQKLRDALPMEMKLFFLDMIVRRRSQTGYIPRVFGVGTRLWSPEVEALRSVEERTKEEEVAGAGRKEVLSSRLFPRDHTLDKEEKTYVSPSSFPLHTAQENNHTQKEEVAPQRRSALQRLLDDWASPEKKIGPGGGKKGKESPSDKTSLPFLPRRQLVSVMDFFAAVDGKPERMGELLAGFEEWYRLMMVECFDVGHPPRWTLHPPN